MPAAISLDALRVLDAIARKGSFAGAAEELHRVPSAVSYSMQKLEQDLEVSLFNRSGHRSTLTQAGQIVLAEGRRLLEASHALAQAAKQAAAGWEPEFSIAVDGLVPAASLFPLIKQFNALQPQVNLRLHYEVLGGGWEAIEDSRADLVIGANGDECYATDISKRAIAEVNFVYTAAPSHPLCRFRRPLQETDLKPYQAIVVADSSQRMAPRSTGFNIGQTTLVVPDMESKIAAQCAGLGVGYLPEFRIKEQLKHDELRILDMAQVRPKSTLYIAWKNHKKSKILNWFNKKICQEKYLQPLFDQSLS